MTAEAGISLQRLLPRDKAAALVAAFSGWVPHTAVAVVGPDGRVFACGGEWPDGPPSRLDLHGPTARWTTTPGGVARSGDLRVYPLVVGGHTVGAVVGRGPVSDAQSAVEQSLRQSLSLHLSEALEKRDIARETLERYREVNLLYRVGETIGRSLSPAAIPQLVLDHSRLIKADVGLAVLFADGAPEIKATFGELEDVAVLSQIARESIGRVWPDSHPAIITEVPGQPLRYAAILWAPLRTRERVLGGLVLARTTGQPVFSASDEKLLMALATPSALALENAQLFDDLQRALAQTTEMKRLLENAFAFITPGTPTAGPAQDSTVATTRHESNLLGTPSIDAVASSVPLFAALPVEARAALATQLDWFSLPGGWTLFQQGEAAEALYIVLSGRLGVVVKGADGRDSLVGEVSGGEVVGEMAVISEGVRSATVVGLRNTTLLRLSKTAFETLVSKHPEAMLQLAQLIVRRLERAIHGEAPKPAAKTFAVLPLGSDVPVSEFTRQLTAALTQIGLRAYLVGEDDARRNTEWFHNVEAASDAVVYEANASLSAWTQLCLRQADCILLTACANADAAQRSEVEERLDAGATGGWQTRRELVLLQPREASLPSRTARWLATRTVAMHHHVRLDRATDSERLARLLTGRAIGLVLSGGAARGAAHLGVIRALREVGVPIDLVGGASIGAIVAGEVAHEWDDETMLRMYGRSLFESNPLGDFTLPLVSLVAGRRMSRLLREGFGDVGIEDLWLNFFCVSSNLTSGRLEVHRAGPLWRAVRASAALPGILPPVVERGEVLVDGGVMNNLPVDVMRQLGRGPVVAIDVGAQDTLTAAAIDLEALSVWRQLAAMVRRRRGLHAVPNIVSILLRSGTVSTSAAAAAVRAQVDVLLQPPATPVGGFDWKDFERVADVGYRYATEELARLQTAGRLSHLFSGGS